MLEDDLLAPLFESLHHLLDGLAAEAVQRHGHLLDDAMTSLEYAVENASEHLQLAHRIHRRVLVHLVAGQDGQHVLRQELVDVVGVEGAAVAN